MKILLLILTLFLPATSFALTGAQLVTLANGIKAETNPAIVTARNTRDDWTVYNYVNSATTTLVWSDSTPSSNLVDVAPLTLYDGLTQGKRDEWRLLLDYNQSMDMRNTSKRNVIVDAWGTASRSVPILQAGTRYATRGELYFGASNPQTTNSVSAVVLNYYGTISLDDVSNALNLAQ